MLSLEINALSKVSQCHWPQVSGREASSTQGKEDGEVHSGIIYPSWIVIAKIGFSRGRISETTPGKKIRPKIHFCRDFHDLDSVPEIVNYKIIFQSVPSD